MRYDSEVIPLQALRLIPEFLKPALCGKAQQTLGLGVIPLQARDVCEEMEHLELNIPGYHRQPKRLSHVLTLYPARVIFHLLHRLPRLRYEVTQPKTDHAQGKPMGVTSADLLAQVFCEWIHAAGRNCVLFGNQSITIHHRISSS